MRTRFVAITTALVLGMVVCVALVAAPAPKDPPPAKGTRWEYKVFNVGGLWAVAGEGNQSTEKSLNKLGEDGWEMIAAVPSNPGGAAQWNFKRAK
jgi:Domain of unknown function (DUF4177)